MAWACKVCIEKDKRISDLQAHLQDLRQLTLPKNPLTSHFVNVEANAIIDGRDEVMPLTEEEAREMEDTQREADRLFAGTY